MASSSFVFCFNRLPYILIDYKGLRGSFSIIFNRLLHHFNQTFINFWFWVTTKVNLIYSYVILIDYLHVFFLCCNLLHLFVFTLLTTIIAAFTIATHLNQPKRLNLSLKANPNLSTNHTNTSSKIYCYHPSLNANIFCSQTLCLLFKTVSNPSIAQKKAKTSKKKQQECSQVAINY